MSITFKGTVGGVTYDDPTLFEKAARNLGFCRDGSRRASRVKVGTEISVTIDGERVAGQVWDKHPSRGYVWLALDNGRYGEWHIDSGGVRVTDAKGDAVALGRVA